jgi:hypothetical protein
MPYMKKVNGKSVRDYKRENDLYNSRPEQIAKRSERTTARRAANADGRTSKGDGTNLDHRKPLSKGGTSARSNLRVVSESSNKSFSRNKDGSMKSQTSKRERKKK